MRVIKAFLPVNESFGKFIAMLFSEIPDLNPALAYQESS